MILFVVKCTNVQSSENHIVGVYSTLIKAKAAGKAKLAWHKTNYKIDILEYELDAQLPKIILDELKDPAMVLLFEKIDEVFPEKEEVLEKRPPKKRTPVEIYCDGSCSGNPGRGGWGAILKYDYVEKEIFGGESDTTNNRMELMAAIKSLEALTRPTEVIITLDSQYVQLGITQWIKNWKKNGWKSGKNEPVKNRDLWEQLDSLAQKHDITWNWVKSHAGNEMNERADGLAKRGQWDRSHDMTLAG